tara:strand:- start:888 stop:1148 length:261 start_codon:yes stop_codon:yes gene_type:complete
MIYKNCSQCKYEEFISVKELLPNLFQEYEQINILDKIHLEKCHNEFCDSRLCPKHVKEAKLYGKYYLNKEDYILCDNCCSILINKK